MDALEAMDRLLRGEGLTFSNGETLYLKDLAAFHASPPCEFGSRMTSKDCIANHDNLIPQTQERLRAFGKPYSIENIPDNKAWLNNPIMLCGTMFGLYLHRHRYFECYPKIFCLLNSCVKVKEPVLVTGCSRRKNGRREYRVEEIRQAMKIDWMVKTELDKAIPWLFTEFIGKYLLQAVEKGKD
jgi:DNA (cytosine-5)-methyltransferase 1